MQRGPDLLSKYLTSTGTSYRDLANRLGTAASQVCRWLNGRVPSLDAAFALEDEAGIPAKSWRARNGKRKS